MAEGDIGAVIASFEFDEGQGVYPKIIHIAGDVYAIVYQGVDGDGWIKTVTISAAGAIALVVGGSLEFDTGVCAYPDIIHVSGDVYAIVYEGVDVHGWIKTVTISAAGAIALVVGGELEFDAVVGQYPTIVHVDDNVYTIAYASTDVRGWLISITISAAGEIAFIPAAKIQFSTADAYHTNIFRIGATNVFAIAYQEGYDGWLATITIDNLGGFGIGVIARFEFETDECHFPDVIHVLGDVYAITYKGGANDGWIKTVTISNLGAIALVVGGSLEFDAVDGWDPDIVHVSGTVYAVAYKGVLYDGWIKTVTISAAGAIALTGSSREFDTVDCAYPDIIHVSGDVFVIAYTGTGTDGWLATVPIERAVAAMQHLMIMGVG